MMTFILVSDFALNARLLDPSRLGKQRVEAVQILNAINKIKGGWVNHPIVKAWKPYVNALKYYTNCIILEYIRRGYNNKMELFKLPKFIIKPWWAVWDRLHQSHRAMLYRKDPFYYSDKFEINQEHMNYGYIWPHDISWKDRNLPLNFITSPIPNELVNPNYCSGILKSGDRKGQKCNRLVKNKSEYCTIHTK